MALTLLAHYNIRAFDPAATHFFYTEVLGLTEGPRPPFAFPGLWLYCGDRDVVHVVYVDRNDAALAQYLGDKSEDSLIGGGAIDHVAFLAEDLPGTLIRLAKHGVKNTQRQVPMLKLYQVFVDDPNGVTIELNFPAAEYDALQAQAPELATA